jgi:hypothetical protein
MLLVSDDKSYKELRNVDDQLGNRVDIPTVIIRRDEGQEIRNYMNSNPNDKVVFSIKFSGSKSGEGLTIEIFMRSDDMKSLHFFKEFQSYYHKLSKNSLNIIK